MSKKIIVLFSGGLDSTYLLWKNLKDGNEVYPIYLEIKNNENKNIVELQQTKLIVSELEKEFKTQINLKHLVSFEFHGWGSNASLPQPLIWICSMVFGIESFINEIQMGYIIGDDAISYIKNIKQLYKSTKPFIQYSPKLKFPLIKINKYELINELPERYHKYLTSCENPKLKNIGIKYQHESYRFFEPCCSCIPCQKIISHDYFDSKIIEKKYKYPLYKLQKINILDYEIKTGMIKDNNIIKAEYKKCIT